MIQEKKKKYEWNPKEFLYTVRPRLSESDVCNT